METNVRGRMLFEECDLKTLAFHSNAADTLRAVLLISAPLTADLADKLKVAYLFKPNGDPVIGPEGMALGYTLIDNDLSLPIGTTEGVFENYRAAKIGNFKIKRKDDLHLLVEFNAHIVGDHQAFELLTFRKRFLAAKFECAIRSLQEEFRFDGSTENDGTQVPMSGGKAEVEGPLFQQPECIHCNNDVPKNEDGKHMVNGELTYCLRSEAAILRDESRDEAPASLPRAATMGAGRTKQRERRKPTAEEVDEATLGVSVQ